MIRVTKDKKCFCFSGSFQIFLPLYSFDIDNALTWIRSLRALESSHSKLHNIIALALYSSTLSGLGLSDFRWVTSVYINVTSPVLQFLRDSTILEYETAPSLFNKVAV